LFSVTLRESLYKAEPVSKELDAIAPDEKGDFFHQRFLPFMYFGARCLAFRSRFTLSPRQSTLPRENERFLCQADTFLRYNDTFPSGVQRSGIPCDFVLGKRNVIGKETGAFQFVQSFLFAGEEIAMKLFCERKAFSCFLRHEFHILRILAEKLTPTGF